MNHRPEKEKAKGQTEVEHPYLISSLDTSSAEQILKAKRRHWRIENGLHWRLDMAFGEDASRVRTGQAAENWSTVRRFVISALRQEESVDDGTRAKRLHAG